MKRSLLYALALMALVGCGTDNTEVSHTRWVNPMIGTGGHGHTFPGAVLPHGMVQLSPDTRLIGWDACSGYHHSDSTIMGFSHTHLSGTGIGDYGDILFMPVVGDKSLATSIDDNHGPDYRSAFSHADETARPGYYQVLLLDDSIRVELTATPRVGMHRYEYPEGADARLIVDMEPTLHGHRHPVTQIRVLNDTTIEGLKYTEGWSRKHYVYFRSIFSSPFDYQLYRDAATKVDGNAVDAPNAKAVLTFRGSPRQVMAKTGISSCDAEGAGRNLLAEIPHWDFDAVAEAADGAWEKELAVIDVETDDSDAKTIFYTALYHSLIQPSLASDVDGRYRTMDHRIDCDPDYTDYTVFSLWDTYRAAHPLYTIIAPDRDVDFVNTLLRKYCHGGLLPKWELAANETGTMIGYHAVSVIADALCKDLPGIDRELALQACVRSSTYDTTGVTPIMAPDILNGRMMSRALRLKNETGLIPCDSVGSSVSQGLEYAYCDWLIAQMANDMARGDIAELYAARGDYYKNYFDPKTLKMRGRHADGTFCEPFDPRSVERPSNYTEGNAWQWTWFVPQDIEGLMMMMGGPDAFEQELDRLFTTEGITGDASAAADVTGLIGNYAHGNEPSHHIPYIYNYLGHNDKTQRLTDYIMRNFYLNAPDGLAGNEDVGQMSAWYVLSAMGLYQVCPGVPIYDLGRPMFDRVVIHQPEGKDFTIIAMNNAPDRPVSSEIRLNGQLLPMAQITHTDIVGGATVTFNQE